MNINLPPDALIITDVERALQEDIGSGDITAALLPANQHVTAMILAREPIVMCGQAWASYAFKLLDPEIKVRWLVTEGVVLDHPQVLAMVAGCSRSILTAERVALNFLQTLSGTATHVQAYVKQLEGTSTKLLDTRKTLPGLRHAQKYAVRCGGGINHRMGLFDAFLIKENHIKASGSISAVIAYARRLHADRFLEIEVETLNEFEEALQAKPDRILLDNFSLSMLHEAVLMNQAQTTSQKISLEASGGVTLNTIRSIAATGVDYISVGDMTKSVRAVDLSLLLQD
jgi:nicotinate-nucleotide pyrophosphorylase (carboxylating)